MARPKKKQKAKEPIRLREMALKDGRKSLYLDIYTNGKRSYQFLKLYLIPETSPAAAIENTNTLEKANAIKDEMIYDLTNKIAGITDKSHKSKMLLVDWMELYRQDVERRKGSPDTIIKYVMEIIKDYKPDVALQDVDRSFVQGLFEHFVSLKPQRGNGDTISRNTAYQYLKYIRAALNYAIRENVMQANPFHRLTESSFRGQEHKREYLTVQEVKALGKTPCRNKCLKAAFMFSCFCGLRVSDIMSLKWSNIVKNGNDWQVETIQHKTGQPIYLPLNMNARKWLPEQGEAKADNLVFQGYYESMSTLYLSDWITAAGITKHISFHCARHTFATLCLTAGVDIYTTSKLLGHANIRHTQRYARIINSKKDAVVSMLDHIFDKEE